MVNNERRLQSMVCREPIAGALIGIRLSAAAAFNGIDAFLCNLKGGYSMLEGESREWANLHTLLNK